MARRCVSYSNWDEEKSTRRANDRCALRARGKWRTSSDTGDTTTHGSTLPKQNSCNLGALEDNRQRLWRLFICGVVFCSAPERYRTNKSLGINTIRCGHRLPYALHCTPPTSGPRGPASTPYTHTSYVYVSYIRGVVLVLVVTARTIHTQVPGTSTRGYTLTPRLCLMFSFLLRPHTPTPERQNLFIFTCSGESPLRPPKGNEGCGSTYLS